VYFDSFGWVKTRVFLMGDLRGDDRIIGPGIIMDQLSTILVEPNCTAEITMKGDIRILVGRGEQVKIGTEMNSIQLSIFSHRFMSIAEQMGRILQRTAISTNIKERYYK